MDYLLKASALIIIFYICYKALLHRETFFASNRWFLLIGLFVASIIPTIAIPIYIEYTPQAFEGYSMIETTTNQPTELPTEKPFDWMELTFWIYWAGVIFFLGRLIVVFFSLLRLFKSHKRYTIGKFTYIETTHTAAPFSFFNWIVYNPNQFTNDELQLIIKHEQVHASQFHSIDMLVSHITTAIFWFNPFMWFYKKELQQNLEFIADQRAQNQSECEKSYQILLLKASIQQHQLMLTNNFYNSLIKKRIIMLHKSKSKKLNAWKYALIIPAITLFMMSFNTKAVYIEKNKSTNNPSIENKLFENNASKKSELIINKDFSDADFENLKKALKDEGFDSNFEEIKRNNRGEITAIKVDLSSETTKANFHTNGDEPIKPITISINNENNSISISNGKMPSVKEYSFSTQDSTYKVQTSGQGSNIFMFSSDEDEDDDSKHIYYVKKDKDGKKSTDTIRIKKNVKNVVFRDDDGKKVSIIALENGNKAYAVSTNSDAPLYVLNGNVISQTGMDDVDPNTIENMTVIKAKRATDKYGNKGKNGVVEINSSSTSQNTSYAVSRVAYSDDTDTAKNATLFYISKDSKETIFNEHKAELKKLGITAEYYYSKVKRKKSGKIISLKIGLHDNNGQKVSATFEDSNGISDIRYGIIDGKLVIQNIK